MKTSEEQANWSLSQWLNYLEQQHHKEIDLGLERISLVANALCAARPGKTIITVAGTNGKGSTVKLLEEILRAEGYSVGTYTSPHFLHYAERVRLNGENLSDQAHCQAFAAVQAARGETSLTYFEFGTLAAFWLLAQQQPDFAILEIGLGGRLDAVNVVEPDISVVTSVAIDHVDFLGNDREQIGFEKAGIYRANKPAICGETDPPQTLIAHAKGIGAQLRKVNTDYSYQVNLDDPLSWNFQAHEWQPRGLPMPSLPLANAATALAALAELPRRPTERSIHAGLVGARLPGRLEVINEQPLVILDVAHNPHAAAYLAQQLQQRWPGRSVLAVCGMLNDKDVEGTVAKLMPVVNAWYCATTPGARGLVADSLAASIERVYAGLSREATMAPHSGDKTYSVTRYASVKEAYERACADAKPHEIVLCFGSFLTIQAIYQLEG